MTVKVLIGNLFDSKAQTLVNTVNCVGVMGKGIALEFKKQFPEMYEDYVDRCRHNEVKLGVPYLYKRLFPPNILNFPTKDHWRSLARIDSIVKGIKFLVANYEEWGIESIAVPPLGCGEGQLEWRIVGPTLYGHLQQMKIPVELYAPYGTPHRELQLEFLGHTHETNNAIRMPEPTWIKPSSIALVEILKRIEEHPYHFPVGKVIFQKIAYIATIEGLPTELKFEQRSYGPFSSGLDKLRSRLLNNGLIVEKRKGNMIVNRVGPTYYDAYNAYRSDLDNWEAIIERVADLFHRFYSSRQAELVATIIFSAKHLTNDSDKLPSENEVLKFIMKWKARRKPPFDKGEVALTIRNLAALDWLDVKASSDLPLPQEAFLDF
jgi:uncharacterized protein YwgA/O-acetyl-ADP-ribose deacetylase (regulator of RNase III)